MKMFFDEGSLWVALLQGQFVADDVVFLDWTMDYYFHVFGKPKKEKMLHFLAALEAGKIVFKKYGLVTPRTVQFEEWLARVGFPDWKWSDHSEVNFFSESEAAKILRADERFREVEIFAKVI